MAGFSSYMRFPHLLAETLMMPKRTRRPSKPLSPRQQAKLLQQQLAKQQRQAETRAWLKAHPKTRIALYAGSLAFVLLLCGLCANASRAGFQDATPTATAALSLATDTPTSTAVPTHVAIVRPTPQPTSVVTHALQPTQPPRPTPTPTPCADPCNPWGYSFAPGNLIYTPNPDFCSVFSCISNFWNGVGFVNECHDGMYSKSGGRQGDCSYHGGEWRPLYSH